VLPLCLVNKVEYNSVLAYCKLLKCSHKRLKCYDPANTQ